MRKLCGHGEAAVLSVLMFLASGVVLAGESPKPPATGGSKGAESTEDLGGERRKAMERGREVKANVDLWGDRLRQKCRDTEKVLQGLDLKKIEGQKVAKEQLIDLLDELDLEAAQILDAHNSVITDLRMYRKALGSAPATFDGMAAEFERRAEGIQNEQLKASYADFAAMVRKMARGYETKSKSMDGVESNMEKQIAFVRESRTFISDVKELLDGLPTDDGLETEKWVERVNQYIESFQKVVSLIKETGSKIGQESPTPTRVKPAIPDQTGTTTPRRPITSAADYEARVAALR